MPLDAQEPITPLQSATVLNALKAMAPQVVLIVAHITGKTLDIALINEALDQGYSLVASAVTLFYCYRAIKSRINATQTIVKKG